MKQKWVLLWGWFVLLGLSACLPRTTPETLPTDTPTLIPSTASPTIIWFPATATFTPLPTIKVTPTQQKVTGYGTLFVEDLFDSTDAWVTGSYADGNVAFGNHSLSLAVAQPGGTLTSFRRETYFTDFYLEITAESSLCSSNDTFGVAFWAANARTYHRLALSCSGSYRLERVREKRVTPLTEWLPSSKIFRGPMTSARIGLWAGGGLIRVFFDDEFQSELYTDRSTGGLGVFASSNGGTAVTGVFSNLQIYEVLPENYPPTPEPTLRPTKTALPTIPTP